MKHWRVLGIGDEPSIFWSIKKEMLRLSPGCLIDLATTFEDGQELLLMYTYDVVIADFGSPVTFDLAELIAERRFPTMAISQDGLPTGLANIKIASVISPESLEETGREALKLLRHKGLFGLKHMFKKLFLWVSRALSQLIPRRPREANSYARVLFY